MRTPQRDQRQLVDLHVATSRPDRTGSVLLVEDDEEVAALVQQILDQLGYEVTRAASAAAALGELANGRKVDVVLSDIMMPGGVNRVDRAREVRRRRRDLPVLLTAAMRKPSATQPQLRG